MVLQSLLFIIQSIADVFAMVLLVRFAMQWARVPFRNPLGQFVIAATDWAVRPARKVIPGLLGFDVPSLFLAWLVQGLYYGLLIGLSGAIFAVTLNVIGVVALVAVIETVRLMLYLLFGVLIITAVMSWVNPHAPLAPLFNALARPFLAPFQRVIPPLGGVDLSPLVLVLLVQLLLGFMASLRIYLLTLLG